jgi:hypothetical protein
MPGTISFDQLATSDLIVDAIYESGPDGRLAGEPLSRVLPGSGNMGGFRIAGTGELRNWIALFSTGHDPDWPDSLDLGTGRFEYYGDNREPGHELHETRAGGNRALRKTFSSLHAEKSARSNVPPFFVFQRYPTPNGSRSIQFKGLAVPGHPALSATEDLVAVWKSTDGQRFQNYKATFTILDVAVIGRQWITDLAVGNPLGASAPPAWKEWKQSGKYRPLVAKPTTVIRSILQQAPDTKLKHEILQEVWSRFGDDPLAFEPFAARIFQLSDARVLVDEITRSSVDGGRDAVGRYLFGIANDPVYAEFSLEAKCYRPQFGAQDAVTVGVKEISRLISRIRHRQFGVLVTTSAVSRQAYEEVRSDRHPIVIISGRDIAEILIAKGYNSVSRVAEFISAGGPEFASKFL